MLCTYRIVGNVTKLPGQSCGAGLTSEAADALGLKAGLPVAVSIVDAHAGALGNNDFICYFATKNGAKYYDEYVCLHGSACISR